MNLLAAKLYDPTTAVSKSTATLLAMTAFDTTNLRLAVTVPAHGMVMFKGMVTITGATTLPVVFLGVMQGATVVARLTPSDYPGTAAAATQTVPCQFEAVVTGLTPGAASFDLAYGVDVIVAATAFKYGGPNDAITTNAWGAAQFEAWDPQPLATTAQLAVDASGQVSANVKQVNGTAQTARDLGAQLDAAVSTRAPSSTALLNTDYTAARAVKLDNLDAAVTTRLALASYTAPDNTRPANFTALAITAGGAVTAGTVSDKTGYALSAAGVQAVWDFLTSAAATVGSIGKRIADNLDALVSSRAPSSTALSSADYTSARAAKLDNLDAAVTTRLASAGYTAPDNTNIATIASRLTAQRALNLDNLDAAVSTRSTYAGGDTAGTTTMLSRLTAGRATNLDNLDGQVSTRLASASYTAPDNASVTAIKVKTDQLAFSVAGQADVNLKSVAGTAVAGGGTEANPWGPA